MLAQKLLEYHVHEKFAHAVFVQLFPLSGMVLSIGASVTGWARHLSSTDRDG